MVEFVGTCCLSEFRNNVVPSLPACWKICWFSSGPAILCDWCFSLADFNILSLFYTFSILISSKCLLPGSVSVFRFVKFSVMVLLKMFSMLLAWNYSSMIWTFVIISHSSWMFCLYHLFLISQLSTCSSFFYLMFKSWYSFLPLFHYVGKGFCGAFYLT